MRTLNIKYYLPGTSGAIRNLGIYVGSNPKVKLLPANTKQFEISEKEQNFKVKMDFWKSEIKLPEGKNDLHLIIYLKGSNVFSRFFLSFTRTALAVEVVSKDRFDEFNGSFYKEQSQLIKKVDSPSFLLTLGLILYFMFVNFTSEKVSEDMQHLIWITFIIGITTIAMLWADRRKTTLFTYKSRMIVLGALLLAVTATLTAKGLIALGWLLILIPPAIIARTLMVEKSMKAV